MGASIKSTEFSQWKFFFEEMLQNEEHDIHSHRHKKQNFKERAMNNLRHLFEKRKLMSTKYILANEKNIKPSSKTKWISERKPDEMKPISSST